MLYKKYHRKYVSQFKKGTVFKWNRSLSVEVVTKEPYYFNDKFIFIKDSKYIRWDLVYVYNGRVNKNLYVV